MELQHFDTIIIGQGLAGTTLAWRLLEYGQNILIVDQDADVTCSNIAAGLITPITGMRLVVSWRFNELRAVAEQFYRTIEEKSNCVFFHPRGMLRLFSNEAEQTRFKKKMENQTFRDLVKEPILDFDDSVFLPLQGGFEMPKAAQLNVAIFLKQSRQLFQKKHCYHSAKIDVHQDIVLTENGVQIPGCQAQADRLIFCQGAEDRNNPWFSQLIFKPAQGEILTLKIPDSHEQRIIKHKAWLCPMPENRFAAGSTYQWDSLDNQPTEQGKNEIVAQLKQFLQAPFEILDHQAAIRPALHDQKPIIGMHSRHKQLGIMNGLGSKGSLQAPWVAENFANHLCHDEPIDPEIDIEKRFPV